MERSAQIEILSLDLFRSLKEEMDFVDELRSRFGMGIGWHYYLDLAWTLHTIRTLPSGSLLLDAGGGTGLLQLLLLELGYNVISVDFATRQFSKTISDRYRDSIFYVNDQSVVFDNPYTRHLEQTYNVKMGEAQRGTMNCQSPQELSSYVGKTRHQFDPTKLPSLATSLVEDPSSTCGKLYVYKADLRNMLLLADGVVDGIVSVSSLEHNDHAGIEACVKEFRRVMKDDGLLAVTTSASMEEDWYHAQSKGWCFSESSLKKLFGLGQFVQSNFNEKQRIFAELRREGNELHKRLAPFYFQSGDNGMPWGKWEPQYMPVGIVTKNKVQTFVQQSTTTQVLVYLDPGFIGDIGHYANFARNIHREAGRRGMAVHHYVNHEVTDGLVREFGLTKTFRYKAILRDPLPGEVYDPEMESSNREALGDFEAGLRSILRRLVSGDHSGARITLFMYTCHPLHLPIIAKLINSADGAALNISAHCALFYLNQAFCRNEPVPAYDRLLEEVSASIESRDPGKKLHLYADSARTINMYRFRFGREMTLLPIPLDGTGATAADRHDDRREVVIGWFGYTHEKQG